MHDLEAGDWTEYQSSGSPPPALVADQSIILRLAFRCVTTVDVS